MSRSHSQILDEVIQETCNIKFPFADKDYILTLAGTYHRTINDISASVPQGGHILEIGAFTGCVSVALKRIGYKVTACDVPLFAEDPTLINYLKSHDIPIDPIDLQDLPLPYAEGVFDAIICCEVIEHLPFNPIPSIREFKRLLKDGGLAYVATPNQACLATRAYLLLGKGIHNPPHHYEWALDPDAPMTVGLHWKEYTRDELVTFFERQGFTCQRHYFSKVVENSQSHFLRRNLVNLLYTLKPSLRPNQVGFFVK